MKDLFNLDTSAGQYRALVLIYLITIAVRMGGFEWIANDHSLVLGALLALLRQHVESK